MAKIVSSLILVGVIITVQALPTTYEEILAAARERQLEGLQEFLRSSFGNKGAWKPATFNSLRDLKPADGGHVYGEAEYSFHSASNIDGKTTEDQGGHKIINDNGQVKEFDFTPTTELLLQPIINPSLNQGNNDYSAVDYSFHYAPSSDGEPVDNIGGKKIANNNVKIQPAHFTPSTLQQPLQTLIIGQDPTPEPLQSGGEEYILQSVSETEWEESLGSKNNNNNEKLKEMETVPPKTTATPVFLRANVGVFDPKLVQIGHAYSDVEYIIESAPAISNEPFENIKSQKIVNVDEKVAKFEITTSTKKSPISSPAIDKAKPKVIANEGLPLYFASKIDRLDQDNISHKVNKNYGKIKVFDITRSNKKSTRASQSFNGVPNLEPGHGNHVFGESQYSYSHSSSYINGKPVEHHGGHPITPKSILSPLSIPDVRNLKPPHGGQVYGEAQYSYHTASNINGKVTEDQGGHKVINNNGEVQEFDFTPSPKLSSVSFS